MNRHEPPGNSKIIFEPQRESRSILNRRDAERNRNKPTETPSRMNRQDARRIKNNIEPPSRRENLNYPPQDPSNEPLNCRDAEGILFRITKTQVGTMAIRRSW